MWTLNSLNRLSGMFLFMIFVSFTLSLTTACSQKPQMDRETRFKKLSSEEKLKSSKSTYLQMCARCHGEKGKGKTGPSLVDSKWIHASENPDDVARIIREGVVKKGMPPWGHLLGANEARSLAQWILSLVPESKP